MSQIFLPLRSNSAWFAEEEGLYELERRIKNCIILYDEIIIQDGRYVCRIGETGSFDILMPSNRYPGDRTKLEPCKTGENFSVLVGGQKITSGKADVAYETDFYPIVNNAGLVEMDYFKWIGVDLEEEYKKIARKEMNDDLDRDDIAEQIPDYYFKQKNILESLYIDSLFAFRLNLPFIADFRMGPIIRWKNHEAKLRFKPVVERIFYNAWLSIGLPDFGILPWEDIHEIRESRAGQDLRIMVDRIATEVKENLPGMDDERDIALFVNKHLSKELVDQLMTYLPKAQKALLNLGSNLIPYGGGALVGGIKDLRDLVVKRNSWVSLLEIKSQ